MVMCHLKVRLEEARLTRFLFDVPFRMIRLPLQRWSLLCSNRSQGAWFSCENLHYGLTFHWMNPTSAFDVLRLCLSSFVLFGLPVSFLRKRQSCNSAKMRITTQQQSEGKHLALNPQCNPFPWRLLLGETFPHSFHYFISELQFLCIIDPHTKIIPCSMLSLVILDFLILFSIPLLLFITPELEFDVNKMGIKNRFLESPSLFFW